MTRLVIDVIADRADCAGEAAVSVVDTILFHRNCTPAVYAAKTILNLVEEHMGLRHLRHLR